MSAGSGTNKFFGVNMKYHDNSAGADGDVDATDVAQEGHIVKQISGLSQSDVGNFAYCSAEEDSLTTNPATATKVGWIIEVVRPGYARIKLIVDGS